MRVYIGKVPVDEFTHTLRLRGPVIHTGVEPGSPGCVEVWSLWDPDVPETVHRFRIVSEGKNLTAEEIPLGVTA